MDLKQFIKNDFQIVEGISMQSCMCFKVVWNGSPRTPEYWMETNAGGHMRHDWERTPGNLERRAKSLTRKRTDTIKTTLRKLSRLGDFSVYYNVDELVLCVNSKDFKSFYKFPCILLLTGGN